MATRVRLAWIGLFALVFVGLAAVSIRAAFPSDAVTHFEPARLSLLARLGLTDPLADERSMALAAFDGRFAGNPVATALHIVAGGLFLLLVPLQLWRRLRSRHPSVHRVVGRVALGAGLVMVLTALYFGLLMPFAGIGEAVTMALVTAWYAYATTRAVVAIRRLDVVEHREWMLRAAAVPLGVATIRIAGLAVELALLERALGPRMLFLLSIWSGWALTIGTVEYWIRTTRFVRPVATLERSRAA
ncbi:MAG TPA: DUF2306 domain-containing protein [Gemmatimonadaceae bacterium]|nr:DUF2306 domain-containing protein [Gemmatimonadaceae bacterium]